MMRALSLTLGALSALVAVSNSAILQKKTLVFPKGFAKLEGPQSAKHSGRGAPWTRFKQFRYMQAIDFGNSLKGKIQAIAMRRDSSSLSGPPFQPTPLFFTDIELWLSTAGLTNIFAFSQNFNRNIGRIVVKVIARKRINCPPVRSVSGVPSPAIVGLPPAIRQALPVQWRCAGHGHSWLRQQFAKGRDNPCRLDKFSRPWIPDAE